MAGVRRLCCLALLAALLCTGCAGQGGGQAVSTPTPVVTPSAEPTPTPTPEPTPTPTPEPTPTPLPLEGAVICVDPGHCVTPLTGTGQRELVSPLSDETKYLFGGGTAGANQTEEQLNLAVGLQLRDALEALGAEVVMTREVSEITLGGIDRCKIAQEAGADVHISIHANGWTDPDYNGAMVLVPYGDLLGTPSIVEESARLGELMIEAVCEHTGAKNLGTVQRSDLTAFNFSTMPCVFIEMGFMTNPREDALMETPEYQAKIVDGMVESLLAWYGVEE